MPSQSLSRFKAKLFSQLEQGDQKLWEKCPTFQKVAQKVAYPKIMPKYLHQNTFEKLKYMQQTMF
jgi:hypothetical protein